MNRREYGEQIIERKKENGCVIGLKNEVLKMNIFDMKEDGCINNLEKKES